ncbi:unnamed protein product [Ectocarpus fasciculatus]
MLQPEVYWPADLCQRDVVRGGSEHQPILLLTDPELIKTVLLAPPDTWSRSRAHELIIGQGLGPKSLFVVRDQTWRRLRRALAPSFARHVITKQASNFAHCAQLATERWKNCGTTTVDIARDAVVMTLALFWSRLAGISLQQKTLSDLSPIADRLVATHRGEDAASYVGLIRELVDEIVRMGGEAVLDSVMPSSDAKFPMSQAERIDNARTMLLAGHETTAASLAWAVWLLADDPSRQARARAEVQAALQTQPLSELSALDLPFCNAVIKEGQRLFPPALMTTRKAERAVRLGDMDLPEGSNVICVFYAMHRRADQFEQPDSFRPERFLGPGAEPQHPFGFLPFSAGQRVCLAGPYADHSALLILASLLADWEFTEPEDAEPVRLGVTLSMQSATPLHVNIKPVGGAG